MRALASSLFFVILATSGLSQESGSDFVPVVTRSAAANRISGTPDYADFFLSEWYGLEAGLESRTRFETRARDYTTHGLISDSALFTRNLLFIGVKGIMGPLWLGAELEDSRRFFSDRIANANTDSGLEVLQAFAQLHWEDAVGGLPANLILGRMAFDIADRRMVARNRNRNAISAFDGLRLRLGDDHSPWEIDAIVTRPVQRRIDQFNASNRSATLTGVTGYWRSGSPNVILEPWWLWINQDTENPQPVQRDIHSFGIHAFGQWGAGGAWDYDLSLAGQVGTAQDLPHRAWAAHLEAGHTWSGSWNPRLAAWLNYATGDQNSGDDRSGRFDPLFGATFSFYGFSSYFSWQNLVNPAVRFSFEPITKLRCELIHRAFWLANSADGWVRTDRIDPAGASGRFIGQETDVRIIWQARQNFEIDIAYAAFFPGDFANATGKAPLSHFFQIAGTFRF
jgi:hypothetical protein